MDQIRFKEPKLLEMVKSPDRGKPPSKRTGADAEQDYSSDMCG